MAKLQYVLLQQAIARAHTEEVNIIIINQTNKEINTFGSKILERYYAYHIGRVLLPCILHESPVPHPRIQQFIS